MQKLKQVPILKIKNIDTELRDIEYDVLIDKVIVQGIIHKQIYYVGIDNIVHYVSEDMSFGTFIEVIGALPGMTADIYIDVEKVIAHIMEDACLIKQKVLLEIILTLLQIDSGDFVAEESKQILITGDFLICEPDPELDIEYEDIVRRDEGLENCQQLLIQNDIELVYTAEKIVNISTEIEGISTEIINNTLIMVWGNIIKDIVYVADSIVRHQREIVPFNIPVNLTQAMGDAELKPHVEIESLKYKLYAEGKWVRQIIVIKACLGSEIITSIRVVSSISGPEIITDTVMVEEEVIISTDPFSTEKKLFSVVTNVIDPLNLLADIEKEIIVLNIVDLGPTPIEVIVSASV